MKQSIPKEVIEASKELSQLYDGTLELIGNYKGSSVYSLKFKEPVTIGLPEIYLWDGKTAKTVYGDKSLEILSSI